MATGDIALVTGAGGFIGHHLVKHLVGQGWSVRGADLKRPEYEDTAAQEYLLNAPGSWVVQDYARAGLT